MEGGGESVVDGVCEKGDSIRGRSRGEFLIIGVGKMLILMWFSFQCGMCCGF